jgi:hypothetical protein
LDGSDPASVIREVELTHPYKMNTPAISLVRTVRTAVEADMLITFMRSAGLHPLDLNTSSHFSLAGADVEYRIEVPTEELNAAREFLKGQDDSPHPA